MKRRDFITLLGGTAAAWPLAAHAQQDGRVRRIGWLIDRDENDPQVQAARAVLQEALAKLGWIEGRNLRIEIHFGARNLNRIRDVAARLVSLAPEVIVINGGAATRELRQRTQTIPIVFTGSPDPVAAGLVRNIARPEGNITGFATFEPSVAGKWLELIKEAGPRLERVSIIFHPELGTRLGTDYITLIETAASVFGVAVIQTPARNSVETVRAIDAFAAEPNGGLLVLPPPPSLAIRDALFQVAVQHRLPTIYGYRELAVAGGLMSYGSIPADQYRGAASYVDRILRGAKVSDLPVQFPTRSHNPRGLSPARRRGDRIIRAIPKILFEKSSLV
jgi:putative tryptophan/tyrosine transport system substrate-binding protein